MCIISQAPHSTTVLQNRQDKTPKTSPKRQSIMEYLPGLQDTKPLRSCSGTRARMILKSHLLIKCHSQYYLQLTRSTDSFSTVPPIVNAGDWGCIVHDLETIIVLHALNFIPQRSHHSLRYTRSWLRDCYYTLMTGDVHQLSKWNHRNN